MTAPKTTAQALADLVEINRRDELTNPDQMATDNWRAEAWENARAALSKPNPRCEVQTEQEPVAWRWKLGAHWQLSPAPPVLPVDMLQPLYAGASVVSSAQCQCADCKKDGPHDSSCAVHGMPYAGWGSCNCSLSSTHLLREDK